MDSNENKAIQNEHKGCFGGGRERPYVLSQGPFPPL